MPWNSGLQGTALNIASYPGTPLRIVAGPGTGKTFALMRRVARLLEQEGVPPDRILAVTFTRTAANDLVEQLAALGVPGANQVAAKTLHAISFGLLSRGAVFQALGRSPRPLMSYELDTLVCDLQDQFGGKRAEKAYRSFRCVLGAAATPPTRISERSCGATVLTFVARLADLSPRDADR
jgi:DNA helicase-2/ATP-dependent DNA helicase PcrA